MVLEAIVANKRAELEASGPRSQDVPANLPRSTRSLFDALGKPETSFILECKKSSPSKGLIRPDFDVVQIARAYAPVADAVSVLTDKKYFQGQLDYLTAVSNQVTVPVLCKDFILEPSQLVAARAAGADAVLLMLSVLDDDAFNTCFAAAKKLGLDALVEVRDEAELARAVSLGAQIVGINNRNLDNLTVDLNTTFKVAPKVPPHVRVVSESGYATYQEVSAARPLVDGFLVGSSVMAQADIRRAAFSLIHGKVKVCGLTRRADVLMCDQMGITYGGLIFVKSSPRYVDISLASLLVQDVSMPFVGVFADAPPTVVADTAFHLGLAAVQLHGNEDEAYILKLAKLLDGKAEIWKAMAVRDTLPPFDKTAGARLLLDAKSPGSGVPFNWALLDGVALDEIVLAGGVGPENCAAAAARFPFALDVNSGVERRPGQKDEQKLQRLLKALRGHTERLHEDVK